MWKRGLAFALLAGCAEDFGSEEQDVINGAVVTTATYKSIAMITYTTNQNQQAWFCTGVLIDPSYVLTQAWCFDQTKVNVGDASDRLNVYLGVDQISDMSGSSWYAVTEAGRETSTDWGHDLAILHLSKPVTDRAPSPIARIRPADGTMTTLVGYGSPDLDVNNQDALRKGSGPTVSCTGNGVSASNVLCVGASAAGACNGGDMGGPLFDAAGNVVGIFNDQTKSQCNQGYDVYSSTADELAFIDLHVPVATTTVPPPTTTPPPGDTGDPSAPPTAPAPTVGGCSAGGGQGGLLLIGLAFIARRARSKRS